MSALDFIWARDIRTGAFSPSACSAKLQSVRGEIAIDHHIEIKSSWCCYQKDHPMPILIPDLIFVPRCTLALATICEALSMMFDIILSVTMAISLLVYIVIATTPPERS
jgi:hypothetical protein